MWVQIPTATMGLMSSSKTLYHSCFSPPRSKWVPVRAELAVVFDIALCALMTAIELYIPQGVEMVSGMIYAPDEQG